MALKRCRKCGLPLRLSKGYEWPGNGVILSRSDPSVRMVMFEAGYYTYVWSVLEELLGVNMADVMVRGQQAATQDYLDTQLLYGWRKAAMRHLPLRIAFGRVMNELALFGFTGLELLEYRRRKLLVIKVKHPFDIISIAWGTKGMVEFSEDMGSELAWQKDGDDYIVSILFKPDEHRGEPVDLEALRYLRDAKRELSLTGTLLPPQGDRGEPCPSCGLPRVLSELEWREDEGTIRRRDNNRRFIFTSGHIFLAIVKDLEKNTGRELAPTIMQISKDYHLRILQGIHIQNRNSAYQAAARYLFAGGFGNVRNFNCGEGYLEMIITNPFYIPRLVGRIAGLFEYVEGQEAEISFRSTEPQLLELEIRTA
jgi:hypothetical protein